MSREHFDGAISAPGAPAKPRLLDHTRVELDALLQSYGEPAFRAKQVFGWLHRGVPFEAMLNLPQALRMRLAAQTTTGGAVIRDHVRSGLDGTVKFLFAMEDGHVVEGVRMRYRHGNTLCISTQVGCRMGCAFCASTLDGCARGLTCGEMLGQIIAVNGFDADAPVHNVVLMGSGEPLDNYAQTVRFLRLLHDPDGLCIGLRNVSLSTCGLVPQMRAFAQEGLPVTLSVSLHAPDDEIRRRIMPVANAWPMEALLDACRYYIEKTGRRVIFEYALMAGVNCEAGHARALAARLRGMQCHVNLIPLNHVAERGLRGADARQVQAFLRTLEGLGISATVRREMGDDIGGACGQLRRHYLEKMEGEGDA